MERFYILSGARKGEGGGVLVLLRDWPQHGSCTRVRSKYLLNKEHCLCFDSRQSEAALTTNSARIHQTALLHILTQFAVSF
jgi:hypothetical protein